MKKTILLIMIISTNCTQYTGPHMLRNGSSRVGELGLTERGGNLAIRTEYGIQKLRIDCRGPYYETNKTLGYYTTTYRHGLPIRDDERALIQPLCSYEKLMDSLGWLAIPGVSLAVIILPLGILVDNQPMTYAGYGGVGLLSFLIGSLFVLDHKENDLVNEFIRLYNQNRGLETSRIDMEQFNADTIRERYISLLLASSKF